MNGALTTFILPHESSQFHSAPTHPIFIAVLIPIKRMIYTLFYMWVLSIYYTKKNEYQWPIFS